MISGMALPLPPPSKELIRITAPGIMYQSLATEQPGSAQHPKILTSFPGSPGLPGMPSLPGRPWRGGQKMDEILTGREEHYTPEYGVGATRGGAGGGEALLPAGQSSRDS